VSAPVSVSVTVSVSAPASASVAVAVAVSVTVTVSVSVSVSAPVSAPVSNYAEPESYCQPSSREYVVCLVQHLRVCGCVRVISWGQHLSSISCR
jgi:hypothetical protein